MKGRVLIVDDHDLLRSGVAAFLSHQWDVVGQAGSGKEALRVAQQKRPDLVIMDITMPPPNGIETTRLLLAMNPAIKVVLFTQQVGREQVRAAFQAGAKAFVAKQSAARELMLAMEAVQCDAFYVTRTAALPELAGVAGRPLYSNPSDLIQAALTSRQADVLRLIASGRTIKEIAGELGISAKTVEFHRNSIADELGIRTTAELTRYALQNGFLDL